MPAVVAYHQVTDRDHWLSSDLREKRFAEFGITNIRTYTDPTNAARVAISADVPDVDAFVAWLRTEDGAATAKSDGVSWTPLSCSSSRRPTRTPLSPPPKNQTWAIDVPHAAERSRNMSERHRNELWRYPPVQGRNQGTVRNNSRDRAPE